MKIALAQCNFRIGDFSGNEKLMLSAIRRAIHDGASLIVFSELSVCGYPPWDLLETTVFREECYLSVQRIAEHCQGVAAIVGSPAPNTLPEGKALFNAAWFLANGEVRQIACKGLLPTYDVFDEYRYFEPATDFKVVEFAGLRIALTICEDLWDVGEDPLYTRWPMEELAKQEPHLMINIAASPYHQGQIALRESVLRTNVQKYKTPLIYVNQVGANTDLLFDGGSLVMNAQGETVCRLSHFCEDYQVVDLEGLSLMPETRVMQERETEICYNALITGIRDYFSKLGFHKAVLGLSGGLDSALVLVLAAEALGNENVTALLMPSRYSSDHSITDARALAENLGVPYEIIPIEQPFAAFESTLNPWFCNHPSGLTEENIQARIRGVLLMAWANKFGHILLNTSNKSEAAVGYGTLYGDMCGALAVIGDLYKTEVYEMAQWINRHQEVIPVNIIQKPPSAELRPDQKDEDSLPPYPVLDHILKQYIEEQKGYEAIIQQGSHPEVVRRVLQLVQQSEHKRWQSPPVLRVSSKAFGYGRRIPIVSAYNG